MFQALFDQAFGFDDDDLATFELAVFIGHLQQVTQVGLTVILVGQIPIQTSIHKGPLTPDIGLT